ncbi:transcriptional regulator [Longimycelium tulufanense]|uniref:Transcriptional regulator n=1 Tax=Longimycelium tulufanense TaxID=907463 RepID=A0A8J3CEL5_9PSEU|nr:helix-turn-helix transcriptional regulator [Longimycelium tulufanense]GGM83581.1 transcriptional regulator [Longimycelium tulufanense]
MGQARQTMERRQLGLTLQRLRDQAAKSQQEAADAIGKVRSRIVQLENGTGTVSPDDLDCLLDFYGVTGAERETVLALGMEARKRQKRRTYTDFLPGAFQRLADLEDAAREIWSYDVRIIPGPLQSPNYVRETIESGDGIWWSASEGERESRQAFRLERQRRILQADPPKKLHFILTEDALLTNDRNAGVMREQLTHLVDLVEHHPNLTIQVLELGVAGNPAPNGALLVLEFGSSAPRVGVAPVVYGPSTYFYGEADTTALLRAFQKISELAMGPADSARFIRRKLEEN